MSEENLVALKDAEKELDAVVDQDKEAKASIDGRMGNVETMLKSVLDNVSEKAAEKEVEKEVDSEEEFDFYSINPELMMKSMAQDPEGQMEFLRKAIEHSVVDAADLVDEEGYEVLTEDLRKSMEDGESEGIQVLNLIFHTMSANNERMAKRDEMLLSGMAQMAKSFTETAIELVEMKKAMGSNPVKVEEKAVDTCLPDLKNQVQIPGSADIGGSSSEIQNISSELVLKALQKSFKGNNVSHECQSEFYKYSGMLTRGFSLEEIRSKMSDDARNVFDSNLEA